MADHETGLDQVEILINNQAGAGQYSVLLEGQFVLKDGKQQDCTASLTQEQVSISYAGSKTHVIAFEDLVGVEKVGDTELHFHSYIKQSAKCFSGGGRTYSGKVLVAKSSEDATKWHVRCNQILSKAQDLTSDVLPPRRRLLVLINPFSGTGKAVSLFDKCRPMLDRSHVTYTVIKTTHAGHASEIAQTADMKAYDSIIIVSGDGLVHEVLNGLMKRTDWAAALNHFSIGHLPGGTGNGLPKSITDTSDEQLDIISAAFLVAKGHSRPTDMFACAQPDQPLRFGFLSISWAIVSRIDLESDAMRWMGDARYTLAALWSIMDLKNYNGTLEILPAEAPLDSADKNRRRAVPKVPKCTKAKDCHVCNQNWSSNSALSEQGRLAALIESYAAGTGWESGKKPADWEAVESDFTSLWAMNVPHAATDAYVAPKSHFGDGAMDMTFVRRIGRGSLLDMFLGIETGDHVKHSALEYVKAKAFRLTPNSKHACTVAIDGEPLPDGPLEVSMFRGLLNVISA